MSQPDKFADLIPFLANGSLVPEEKGQVEAHVASCDDCASLLEQARIQVRSKLVTHEQMTGHIQSQLLMEYDEAPGTLDETTRNRIGSHLESCELCTDALTVARAVPDEDMKSIAHARSNEGDGTFWEYLKSSFLAPVPALAYMVIALLGIPLLIWLQLGSQRSVDPGPTSQILPPAVLVPGEIAFRQGPGAEGPPPLEFELPRIGELVQLSLRTDIDREDIQDEEASFAVRILDGERPLWSQIAEGSSFSRSRELTLLVETRLLPPGRPLVVEIRLLKPGDSLHDEVLFKRTIQAK
jgi:hypothetical protein